MSKEEGKVSFQWDPPPPLSPPRVWAQHAAAYRARPGEVLTQQNSTLSSRCRFLIKTRRRLQGRTAKGYSLPGRSDVPYRIKFSSQGRLTTAFGPRAGGGPGDGLTNVI